MIRVDENAIFTDLSTQLDDDNIGDNPWVCWPLPNGDMKSATLGFGQAYKPDPDRITWAFERVMKVNKEAWLDGVWLGVWGSWGMVPGVANLLMASPQQFLLCFKDADGAMPLRIHYDEPWHKLCLLTVDKAVEDAMEAKSQYLGRLEAAGIRPDQMDRPVIGQTAKR